MDDALPHGRVKRNTASLIIVTYSFRRPTMFTAAAANPGRRASDVANNSPLHPGECFGALW